MHTNLNLILDEKMIKEATKNEIRASFGHLGTHIDLKGHDFNLKRLKGLVFKINDDEEIKSLPLDSIKENYFVFLNSNHINKYQYGTKEYYNHHAYLSDELIEKLIELKISLIGIDGPGIKQGKKHPLYDKYLADKGIFVVENLCNLDLLKENKVYEISIKQANVLDDGLPIDIIVLDE